jgi:hypothetical protein
MEYKISIKSEQGIVTFTVTDTAHENSKTITIAGATLTIKIVTAPAGEGEPE